jgi:hypothetical protein
VAGLVVAGALDENDSLNWLLLPLVLGAAGLAFAAARLDAEAPRRAPFPRWLGAIAITLAVLAVGIPLAFGGMAGTPTVAYRETLATKPGDAQIVRRVDVDPIHFLLSPQVDQRVTVEIRPTTEDDTTDRVLLLTTEAGLEEAYDDDPDPPTIEKSLSKKPYVLTAGRYATVSPLTEGGRSLALDRVLPALLGEGPDWSAEPSSELVPYDLVIDVRAIDAP